MRFPYDPNESRDNDNDGIGDNADLDDDNDGYSDETEIQKVVIPLILLVFQRMLIKMDSPMQKKLY